MQYPHPVNLVRRQRAAKCRCNGYEWARGCIGSGSSKKGTARASRTDCSPIASRTSATEQQARRQSGEDHAMQYSHRVHRARRQRAAKCRRNGYEWSCGCIGSGSSKKGTARASRTNCSPIASGTSAAEQQARSQSCEDHAMRYRVWASPLSWI